MDIKPIITKQDFTESLKRIDELWGSKRGTPQGDEFDSLCTMVEDWEMAHYPIEPPDPIDE